jgi:hypothetical protein
LEGLQTHRNPLRQARHELSIRRRTGDPRRILVMIESEP